MRRTRATLTGATLLALVVSASACDSVATSVTDASAAAEGGALDAGSDGTQDAAGDGDARRCRTNAQCDDSNVCTRDVCAPAGTCSNLSLPRCVATIAGTGKAGFADGKATTASFNTAFDVAVDPSGATVYVADIDNHRIRKIAGGVVSTIAGAGGSGFADGPAATSKIAVPSGLAVGVTGAVYFSDRNNFRIRRVIAGRVETLAGAGPRGTGLVRDGAAAVAVIGVANGISVTVTGAVYFTDSTGAGHMIRVLAGGSVSTLAGAGKNGFADGPAADAKFFAPKDVAVDAAGRVFIADTLNHRVRLLQSGRVTTVAGTGKSGFVNGASAAASFTGPASIAVDAAGKIYVADAGNHAVRVVAGGQVSTLAGTGKPGYADGPAAAAMFNAPSGVAVDSSGRVYIADTVNNRIRVITP